jgi:hypothetical protein
MFYRSWSRVSSGEAYYDELARTNAELHPVVKRQQAEIESLFVQIRSLKSYIFGSRSERFVSSPSSEQSTLFALPS